jgi:copper(I)-binding protein
MDGALGRKGGAALISADVAKLFVKVFCSALITGFMPVMAPQAFAGTDGLTLSGGWMRIVITSRPAAGYFLLKNNGPAERKLVGASSSGCGMMMLHQSKTENGIDKMMPVKDVTVPAHGNVRFAPGGYHLMCMHPNAAVKPGKSVPVTLTFDDDTSLTAAFAVHGATVK